MQDRFKFRVWNTLVKKFSYFDKPEMQIGTDGFDSGLIFPLSENSNLYMGKYSEPQFCTGLKDENCKLIYEGDIVKNDHEALFYVKWCYNCFQLNPLFKNGYTLGILDDEFEVIGNIYETPELLEVK